jgi:hypothetical protein
VHPAARRAELRAEFLRHLLRDAGEPARERFLTLVEMDIEEGRRDRPKTEARIVPVRGVRRNGDQRQKDGQRDSTPPGRIRVSR